MRKKRTSRAGEILRDQRKDYGWSQEEVANRVGISFRHYQDLEKGRFDFCNCGLRLGLRICAVLGLNPYYVVFQDLDEVFEIEHSQITN
ncbi:MAG: helix-turn-helix transcriptional regulator [Anaerolineaceae bacterium]|nr:helix-turn-helix transcriptional regulator [Anaerolineaceae bacterium]